MSTDRITVKVSHQDWRLLEIGRNLAGAGSLDQFVVTAALEKARVLITAQESLPISREAANVFFDAMLNPPTPNDNLNQAAASYSGADKGNGEFHFPIK